MTKYAPFDGRLQQALQAAKGKPTNHQHGSQGWIFRHAMDEVHGSPRSSVVINRNSKVIAADIAATNGVVHIIDTVLMPPTPKATTTTSFRSTANIVQIDERVVVTDSALDQRLTSGVILTLHILCVLWWVTVY